MMGKAHRHYKIVFERRCRLCLRPDSVRPLTRHHLVPVRCGGSNNNENIVPLCRPCHDLIDCYLLREQLPHRAMLRRTMSPGEVSYVRSKMGTNFLERYYPSREQLVKLRREELIVTSRGRRPQGISRKMWRKMVTWEKEHGYEMGSNGRVSSSPGIGSPG